MPIKTMKSSVKSASLNTLKNHIKITKGKQGITSITFCETQDHQDTENPMIRDAIEEIEAYFNKERTRFDFPLEIRGTAFQKSVYKAIMTIPYGVVWTYKDVAIYLGKPNAQRAVGGALNKNPLSIVVPCHRVIGANGTLVGFGSGLSVKKALLELKTVFERRRLMRDYEPIMELIKHISSKNECVRVVPANGF